MASKGDQDIFELDHSFASLGIPDDVLEGITEVGFKNPTIVQARLIPCAIAGGDILGQSRTGTGKTAAFGIPALALTKPGDGIATLILVPTRELAIQVAKELRNLGSKTKLKVLPVYGGQKISVQAEALEKKPEIIVGTPGRVMDMHQRGLLPYAQLKLAILDEVDRMLDIGFREDIRKILGSIKQKHQTIFVSATISPEIDKLARQYMKSPERLEATDGASLTVSQVTQSYFVVEPWDKRRLLHHLLTHEDAPLTLVFCRTKITCDKLGKFLSSKNVAAQVIHANLHQGKRNQVMQSLRDGGLSVLIASDLVARGIDVENITHVVNYDLPEDPEVYVHRIGRTARTGKDGTAWSFVTPEEGGRLDTIEQLTNAQISLKEYPDFKPGTPPSDIRESRARADEVKEQRAQDQSRLSTSVPTHHDAVDNAKFPGGIVPTAVPNRRLGGRLKTRRR